MTKRPRISYFTTTTRKAIYVIVAIYVDKAYSSSVAIVQCCNSLLEQGLEEFVWSKNVCCYKYYAGASHGRNRMQRLVLCKGALRNCRLMQQNE